MHACASVWRTRATAPIRFVRGPGERLHADTQCCGVLPPSGKVWIFNPTSNFNLAGLNFKLFPWPGDATTLPVTMTEQPVVNAGRLHCNWAENY